MKGVYLAFFQLSENKNIEIGALGEKSFQKGKYIYVGSARTNMEKRVSRHFSKVENLHWHIDYFTQEAEPLDCFLLPEKSEYECVMSKILEKYCEKVESFGASDCGCDSHLFRIPENFSH